MNLLALRLWGYLKATHDAWGVDWPVPPAEEVAEMEFHAVGKSGVVSFHGPYVLIAYPPDDRVAAGRDIMPLLRARLDLLGETRHVVHSRNITSIRATRRLGAVPIGVDADGFIHYILKRENYRYG